MRSIYFAFSWYATALCTLAIAIFLFVYLSYPQHLTDAVGSDYQKYRALPGNLPSVYLQSVNIDKVDARALIIEEFYKTHKSPLAAHSQTFIEVADRYQLDYRLLPAISMQESNGAKKMPKNSYNPFGYGIYGGKVLRFDSFDHAIERVGRGLREDYLDYGLTSPEEIMVKYTPPSLSKGGAWAIGVLAFMEQLL